MGKFLALLRLNFFSMLAAMRMGRKKRAFSGMGALALVAGLSLYISGLYSFLLAEQLSAVGALPLLITLMALVSVVIGFLFSLFAAQGVIFGAKDNDLMLSLPVSPFQLLLARTLALYLENLISTIFILLPAGVIYLWYGGSGGFGILPVLLVCALFLNLLPTLLSLIVGFLLAWLSSHLPRKTLATSLFQLALLALLLIGSFWLSNAINHVGAAAVGISHFFQGWGLPFLLLTRAVCQGNLLHLFGLIGLCLLPFLGIVWLFAWKYASILTRLTAHHARSDYRLGKLSSASQGRALLRKEARRWFGTPIYIFNTGVGLILLPIAGIAALINRDSIQRVLAAAEFLPVTPLLALGICFCLSTVSITGSSISLEGKQLWLLQCAPIPVQTLFIIKAAFQLLVCLPSLLIGWALLSLSFSLSGTESLLLLLSSLLFALANAPFGLWINLRFPKLDAVSDAAVVKQSAAALLSTLLPMGLLVGLFVLWFVLWSFLQTLGLMLLYSLILALWTLCAVVLLCRQGPALFQQLSE